MNHQPSPPRSSSPTSFAHQLTVELGPVIDSLKAVGIQRPIILEDALTASESLHRLRHTVIDNDRPREAKDVFRHLHGFQLLLEMTQWMAELYDTHNLSREERKSLLTLYKDVLAVLAEGLRAHSGNRRYFAKRIAGGGVALLEKSLMTLAKKLARDQESSADTEQLYGSVLAAALCQETVCNFFTVLATRFQADRGALSTTTMRNAVDQSLGTTETVEVPELLGPFLRVWLFQSSLTSGYDIQRLVLPACLNQLASHSRRNTLALHSTGILSSILPVLFSRDRADDEKTLYQDLAKVLCAEGVTCLDDAVDLYRQAYDCPQVLRFLLNALRSSKQPPCIHFDMLAYGYSSVELSTLGRPFPPTASAGYTLAVWARFDHFDPNSHTTIFGAFDVSQTCFVLAYLEKDTRNFILQTSINGPRPSVRFKSVVFEPGRWYHLCMTHRRARAAASSRASLFVDGEFVEQLKIEYPNVPAGRLPHKSPRVQAFFGTPQDLAVRLGKGVATSRWSLANAMLFEDIFSDDMISVFYNLGPRYHGNYQDCLGSFQTYGASAALNLRNESLHPGKEEHSDIVTAVRQKASTLVSESSILINISPTTVFDDDDDNNIDEHQLIKSLSKQAAKNLQQLTKAGSNAIAINGAVPAINDALTRSQGVAVLTGDPVISVPQALDDASWRIGGCAAVHLGMVQAAATAAGTILAVEILFEAVQGSWRNSEAMERENGYGILASLLRDKLGFPQGPTISVSRSSTVCSDNNERSSLAIDLLRLILEFVGYDFENPPRSIITNPLAYRVLLVDLDIWRFGEPSLLQMYYSQFSTFAADSQNRRFNAKRLSRMRKLSPSPLHTSTLTMFARRKQKVARCPERGRVHRGVS
jgi:beige protein homolog 1